MINFSREVGVLVVYFQCVREALNVYASLKWGGENDVPNLRILHKICLGILSIWIQ